MLQRPDISVFLISHILILARTPAILEEARRRVRRRMRFHVPPGLTRRDLDTAWPADRARIIAIFSGAPHQFEPYVEKIVSRYGGKPRRVLVANYFDATIMTAIALALFPLVDKVLHPSAVAYRPKIKAAWVVRQLFDKCHRWPFAVTLDWKSYFASIQREPVFDELRALGVDPAVEYLIRSRFDSGALIPFSDDPVSASRLEPIDGIPQGDPVACLLANLARRHDDPYFGKNMKLYFRYSDDLTGLHESRAGIENAAEVLEERSRQLGLTIKELPLKIRDLRVEPMEYLGHAISQRGIEIAPSRIALAEKQVGWIVSKSGWSRKHKLKKIRSLMQGKLAHFRRASNLPVLESVGLAGERRLSCGRVSLPKKCPLKADAGSYAVSPYGGTGTGVWAGSHADVERSPADEFADSAPSAGEPAGIPRTPLFRENPLWRQARFSALGGVLVRRLNEEDKPRSSKPGKFSMAGLLQTVGLFFHRYGLIHPLSLAAAEAMYALLLDRLEFWGTDEDNEAQVIEREVAKLGLRETTRRDVAQLRFRWMHEFRAVMDVLAIGADAVPEALGRTLEAASLGVILAEEDRASKWDADHLNSIFSQLFNQTLCRAESNDLHTSEAFLKGARLVRNSSLNCRRERRPVHEGVMISPLPSQGESS